MTKVRVSPSAWARWPARWPAGFALLRFPGREGAGGGELRWKDIFFTSFLLAPTFSWGSVKTPEPRNPLCRDCPRWLLVPTGFPAPAASARQRSAPACCRHPCLLQGLLSQWPGHTLPCVLGMGAGFSVCTVLNPVGGLGCWENRSRRVCVPVHIYSSAGLQCRATIAI